MKIFEFFLREDRTNNQPLKDNPKKTSKYFCVIVCGKEKSVYICTPLTKQPDGLGRKKGKRSLKN